MPKPEFPTIRLHGGFDGNIIVYADGKYLGTLLQEGGEFCVRLCPQAIKTIGKPE